MNMYDIFICVLGTDYLNGNFSLKEELVHAFCTFFKLYLEEYLVLLCSSIFLPRQEN